MIEIDLSKDALLSEAGFKTLTDRYLKQGEVSPQEVFKRSSLAFSDSLEMAKRMYGYMSNLWMSGSTPVLANAPIRKKFSTNFSTSMFADNFEGIDGLPISCFLTHVHDSINGLNNHTVESRKLSVAGGGVGAYWGDVRGKTKRSGGTIPFIHTHDADVLAYQQGDQRRGAYAAYLHISHPDIVEFINIRKPTGGDVNRKSINLHNAVVINQEFLDAVRYNSDWYLVCPHTKNVVDKVNAKELWRSILETRHQTGEPYVMNETVVNRYLCTEQQDKGLYVSTSNLCSEITLPTTPDRTAVCCLSSVNLEKWDEWKDDKMFISDVVRFLDNVLEFFILNAGEGFENSVRSAKAERSLGLGAMGFHSLLQMKGIPFESALASSLNRNIFKHIKLEAVNASNALAVERGEPSDLIRSGKRNAHLLAIAPNASSSIYGNTSPSVEPTSTNIYLHKTASGSFLVKNKHLDKIIKEYSDFSGYTEDELWKDILKHEGSVQHLSWMDDYQKDVFKTAFELDQMWVIEHAKVRQEFICQSQSINLFFPAEVDWDYYNAVHWKGANLLKTMYYVRTKAISRVGVLDEKAVRFDYSQSECLSCEG
jgi:ribonucleoside-diphosphate reductase alpha chain